MTSKKRVDNKNSDNVTINDFANAASGLHGRLKKAPTFTKNVSKKEEPQKIESNSKARGMKSKKKSKEEKQSDRNTGIEYPLDLWFLISEYIQPEAVGKFAGICRGSNHVTKTAKFWFHLYKRYYVNCTSMPARLCPDRMVQVEGLRACVVRALHLMYFIPRQIIVPKPYSRQDPDCLVSRRCCLMWNEKGKTRWYFYFKLKEVNKYRKLSSVLNSVNRDELDFDEEKKPNHPCNSGNVLANPEEGCKVLRVSCVEYGMLPLVTGLFLQKVKVNLARPFVYSEVQLHFDTSHVASNPTQIVFLNGVSDLVIMDWWSPYYPHQDSTLLTILEETMESWDFDSSDYLTV